MILACLVATAPPQPANAQDPAFDPATCPTDAQGKVLVLLNSGLAFRFPAQSFGLSNSPVPPAGNAIPEGCPGNPIVTQGIYFPYQYDASLKAKIEGRESSIEPVQFVEVLGPSYLSETLRRTIERFKGLKETGSCLTTSEGLEFCYPCVEDAQHKGACYSDDPSPYLNDPVGYPGGRLLLKWAGATGVTSPSTYETSSGRPFAIDCYPATPVPWHPRTCDVGYELQPGLGISYRIDTSVLPEDEILATDRKIRAQILAARAPEFDRSAMMPEQTED